MPDRRAQRKRNTTASAVQHDAVQHLVHGARRLGAARLPDDLGRHAGNRDIVRYRLDDNGACGDARAMANLDISKNLGTGADHYAAANFRMAVLMLLAGAAKRHIVQDRNVIFDNRRLADDETSRVIEEDAAADLRRRVDVTLENR